MTTVAKSLRALAAATALLLVMPAAAEDKKAPTKDDYEIDVSKTTAELQVGQSGTLVVHIKAKNGLKVHPQAPLEVKLTTSAGLTTEKNKLGRKQAKQQDAESPELSTGMTGRAAGAQTVEASLSFFLCSDTWCQRVTDKKTIAVKVTE